MVVVAGEVNKSAAFSIRAIRDVGRSDVFLDFCCQGCQKFVSGICSIAMGVVQEEHEDLV